VTLVLSYENYTFLKTKNSLLERACHDTMQGYEEEFDYIMDANIAAAQGLSRQYMHNRLEIFFWARNSSASFGCTSIFNCVDGNIFPLVQMDMLLIAWVPFMIGGILALR
jgi:hypothetical protein